MKTEVCKTASRVGEHQKRKKKSKAIVNRHLEAYILTTITNRDYIHNINQGNKNRGLSVSRPEREILILLRFAIDKQRKLKQERSLIIHREGGGQITSKIHTILTAH